MKDMEKFLKKIQPFAALLLIISPIISLAAFFMGAPKTCLAFFVIGIISGALFFVAEDVPHGWNNWH